MPNVKELIRYYEAKLKYFTDELNAHENLNISIFYPEQKEIYRKNMENFRKQIEILEQTIEVLRQCKQGDCLNVGDSSIKS